jgi:hypothetical protein
MVDAMINCLWHMCDQGFTPEDPKQKFCSKACQVARANWKARRGSPLVDLLLGDNLDGLLLARDKMKREIEECLQSKRQSRT